MLQENTFGSWITETTDPQPAQLAASIIWYHIPRKQQTYVMHDKQVLFMFMGNEPSEAGPVPTAALCACHPRRRHQRRGSGAHCGLGLWRSGRVAWEFGEKNVQGAIMMRTMLKMGWCMVEIGSGDGEIVGMM